MHFVEFGPSEGVPVVFLHGSMVAGWMWVGQAEGLPDYRCLLPDLPGIGHSSDEEWEDFATTADHVANLIRDRCTGGSAHVIGLSLGGIIGLHLAVRHPETLRSLVVSGVPSGSIPVVLQVLNRVMLFLYRRPWGARLIGRSFGIPDDESMVAFLETARLTSSTALERIAEEVSTAPLPENLSAVDTPTLAVVGSRDTKPALQAVALLQDLIQSASGYVVPEVGHQWNAEEPELFTDMVRSWISDQKVDSRLMPV